MASNAEGDRGSGSSSSKRGMKNRGNTKAPKVPQRGMGIARLEKLRIQSEMDVAANNTVAGNMDVAATNAVARNVVPNNLHNVPVYQLLDV